MWLLIIAVLLILGYLWHINGLKYWRNKKVPFKRPLPGFGNGIRTLFRIQHITEYLTMLYNKFSDAKYFVFFSGRKPAIILRDRELIKQVTIKEFDAFHQHDSLFNEEVDVLWSKNLISIQDVEKWHHVRASLSPSFTGSKMRIMFKLMNECAANVARYLYQQDDLTKQDMREIFRRYANDVIATTAFGVTCDSFNNRDNEFFRMGKDVINFNGFTTTIKFLLFSFCPPLAKALKLRLIDDKITHFFRRLIKDTIRVREEQGIIRPDMIHLLMEARKGKDKPETNENDNVLDKSFAAVEETIQSVPDASRELTNDDITAQALIFFLAGFETVSSLMSFTAMELAVHPEIQEKLTREIDDLYNECGANPSYAEIMRLKYLDMVISESLRKWPPAILTDRKVTKPFVLPPAVEGGEAIQLQKGMLVWIPIFQIQRDPNLYPDPEKFDPDRFGDENKGNIKPFSYMPFGLGPRNCIGSRFALLEVKVILYHLLANFEFTPTKETVIPLEIAKIQFRMEPKGGFILELKKRIKM